MGYIKDFYGYRNKDFILGFLGAMDTYSIWHNGKRYIGSQEQELVVSQKEAIIELGGNPDDFEI
jgi:hypothetical protein